MSRRAVAGDLVEEAERSLAADLEQTGDDMSISDISHRVDGSTVETLVNSHAIAEVELYSSSLSAPLPSSSREFPGHHHGTVTAQGHDSGSEDSSRGGDSPSGGILPMDSVGDLFYNVSMNDAFCAHVYTPSSKGTLLRPDLIPFFRIKTDLPPEAFIKASVDVSMYPDTFKLLTTTILRLSGGYSNVGVSQKEITAVIGPFMKQMKARGSPLPFKNANKMMKWAWRGHIIRNSVLGDQAHVFLVNTQNAIDRLNLRGASGTHGSSKNNVTRTVSPYLPLVNSIARLAGMQAFVPASFILVRKEVGGEWIIKSLGFPDFPQYVAEASLLGLVTTQGTGKNRTLSLRSGWNHLQSLLVLNPDNINSHV
jgi:hypothetical protein